MVLHLPSSVGRPLTKESQNKVALLSGFKGGWNDDVVAGRQFMSLAYLAKVAERRALGRRDVRLEKPRIKRAAALRWSLPVRHW